MQQILNFFIKNKNFLLFALLFSIAIALTTQSRVYHKSRLVSAANFISGSIYTTKSNITYYFDLKKQNQLLAEENNTLKSTLANLNLDDSIPPLKDSLYNYIAAKVINNSYHKTKNNITLDKGQRDSVKIDMGVISSKGIVGIVSHTSKRFSSVQSILNTNSQVVAKFKKTNHFGTLIWNGKNHNVVQLIEIPRIAPIAIGDTIVTDGKSTIFPRGILIGTVKDYEVEEVGDYFKINVLLFNDMTNLKHVYIVEKNHAEEIKALEKKAEDDEQ